jgi:hypothetical protein
MELRGKKKGSSVVYSGYLKINKNSEFIRFMQWKYVYSAIITTNDYFVLQNLLVKLKYKPRKLRENNWQKIVNEKIYDAEALEYHICKYLKKKEYNPITYTKYLSEKYGTEYKNDNIIRRIDERGIERYVHFTDVRNLDSILEEGLVPVGELRKRGIKYVGNDVDRLDNWLDANSLSVSTPNYPMFYRYMKIRPFSEWIVISYNAKLVADMDCAYFANNAASSIYKDRSWTIYSSEKSFDRMFAGKREDLNSYETTNPQAEVMVRGIIPSKYIETIFFADVSLLKEYQEKYPYVKMSYDKSYFQPHKNFENQRKKCHFNYWM